jgi:hypothetical protein
VGAILEEMLKRRTIGSSITLEAISKEMLKRRTIGSSLCKHSISEIKFPLKKFLSERNFLPQQKSFNFPQKSAEQAPCSLLKVFFKR